MAAYTVRVTVNSGGLVELTNASGTAGESFLNPLELDADDTVTFDGFSIASGRSCTISGLSIFTNNNNVSITSNTSSVTRTVASGGSTSNTVTGTSDLFEQDFFYFTRTAAAPTGTLSPGAFATTENQGGVTVTANVSITGTYYWDLERNAGEPSGANSFGFGSPTSGSLSLTANTNQNFTTGSPNNTSGTSNIGYQGVSFTIDLFTGASRTGTLLDTSNWTIRENDAGVSVGSTSINISAASTTFNQTVTTNWNGTNNVALRIRNTTLGTTVDSFSTTNGNTTLSRTGITAPPVGTTYNYTVQAYNGISYIDGQSFSVTRSDYSLPDTDVTVTSSREYNPGATSYNMTFSNGTNGDEYQLRRYDAGAATGTVVGTATAGASGTFTINVGSAHLSNSGSSDTIWYSLYARRPTGNGGDNLYDYCSGTTLVNSLNLTRRPYTPTINNVTDDDAESANVGIIINVSDSTSNNAGTVDRLYLYQYKNGGVLNTVNRSWGGNGNYSGNFTQPRNTGSDNYYYRAFVQKSGDGAPYTPEKENSGTSFSDYFPSNGGDYQAGYIDPGVGVSVSNTSVGAAATSASVPINNGISTKEAYAVSLTSGLASANVVANSIDVINPYDGSNFSIPNGSLPSNGNTTTYYVYAARYAADGGDGFFDQIDSFTISRNAVTGTVTGNTNVLSETSSLPLTFTADVDGTYYYDVDRVSGSVGSGEITNPGPSALTVSGGSGSVTLTFTNDSVTEIGFQGEEFIVKYGTTSGGSELDTHTFFLYDDDSGITYGDSTINIVSTATSHTVSIIRATGDSSAAVNARVRNVTTNTVIGSVFSLSTGTTNRSVSDAPAAGGTETFRVEVFNGLQYINGPTYTVTRAGAPTAPTSITFEADQNVSAQNITQAVTISGGANGTIQYSENNSTWFNYSGPTDFTFTRNTPKTIYARRNDGSQVSSVSQSSKTYGYFTGDSTAEVSIDLSSISANYTGNVTATVTGGSTGTRYRVRNTTTGSGMGNTGDGNGTVIIGDVANELPGKGETDSYQLQYIVITSEGGDNTWRNVTNGGQSFTISRTNDIPNAFTFDTLTNRALNATVLDSAQITGITQEAVVSRTAGTGTFAVGGATEPSAGSFSTANKTVTNNQYVWVKDTTSTSNGTTKSTTISIGTGSPQSATFSYTTAAAGDITVTMAYDPESGFFQTPILSPTVSGQDGLSQNQAREITAGTDVVFQNTSDPGAGSITVSGLNQFTNNNSFTVAQGSSVTRTWASGVLGNVVDQLSLSAGTAGDLIFFRQPPVAPDLDVTPVTPANIDWDQTTAFNVTVNNVTSGETYKITENNFTTSLGSATASGTSVTIPMTLGNSTTGYGQLGLGDTQTYEIHASRPANLGGTGSFVQTDDVFTVTRSSQVVVTPVNITFSPASTASKSTNVTVGVAGDSTEGRTLQIRIGNGTWLTAPQTYNLTRGETYSFSARTLGFQGASVSGIRVESYQVPYLSPDTSVSVIVATTIAANAGNQTVRVQDGSSLDQYSVTNLSGSVTYDSVPSLGNGNMTLTAASPDELPASGSNQSYRIRVYRPVNSGGAGPSSVVNTNQSFTISRSDPTQPTVTIDADPGTRSKSVSLGVDASGGTGSTFQVSEDNSNFVASGTAFEFTRGVNKTVYGRSLTDSNPSTSGTASRQLAFIAPNTAISLSLSKSTITAGETANITASFTGGTQGDIVDLRTNDTNTPLASGTSVGSATFDAGGSAAITISSGEQPDVTGTSAQYRAYVQTPTDLGGQASYVATSQTASITRGTISQPTSILFPADPGTLDDQVSLTVTVAGGSGGSIQISDSPTSGFVTGTTRAFTFTRNTSKTIYARRIDGAITSAVSNSSFTLPYLTADSTIGITPSATSITAGYSGTITVAITGATSQDQYRLVTTDTNTPQVSGHVVDSFTGTTASSFTIANNELPDGLNSTAGYRVEALRPISAGGDGTTQVSAGTFSITRGNLTAPTSIQFPSDPGTASKSVSLTVTIGGGTGGDLEISENNTTWFTAASRAFEFTRNVPKTIYARRNDNGTLSGVTSSSFELAFLPGDGTVSVSVSESSIAYLSTTPVTVDITNGASNTQYRVVNNASPGTVYDTITGNGTLTLDNPGQLPGANSSIQYRLQFARTTASGGSGSFATATPATFTISRSAQDLVPDAFSFTDKTGVNQNSDQISSVQITGINDTAVASVTQNNGQGVFAVNSSSTPPATGYSSTSKNITNNQYLHARVTASNTLGGTVSSTFAVGSISDNFNVTTTSAQGSYYTITADYSFETEILSFNVSPLIDGRDGQTSGNAILLNPGDIVDFVFDLDPPSGSGTFNSFNSPYWTNTSNLTLSNGVTGSRTWSTANEGGDADTVGISIDGKSDIIYFTTAYPGPDTTVTFDECVKIAASATDYDITITDTGDSTNSASTVYSTSAGGSRTGPGSFTVTSVPSFLGVATPVTVRARLPVAAGGDNSLRDVGQYVVVRGDVPGTNPPGIDTYGIAIYDDQGAFVTSFTGGNSVLREVAAGTTQVTTTGATNVSTGVSGLSSDNAFVAITLNTGTESTTNEGAARGLPYAFINGGSTLQFARSTTTQTIDYTIYQYREGTKGASGELDYGIQITNGDGDIVIDNYGSTYAVSEIINCSTATTYNYGEYTWVVVELTEGDYPLSGGLPVPAIQGPALSELFNAKFSSITYTNSWRKVEFWAKTSQFGNGSGWNLAILTEKNNTTPSFYGTNVNDYGFKVYDQNGNVQWDSNYQQSILNSVVDANQFTTGSSKNGAYDVSTGFDGAIQPVAAATNGQSDAGEFELRSRPGFTSVTLSDEIDPTNTFLLGGYFFTGSVRYYKGRLFIPDFVPPTDEIVGGGTHLPCLSITSNTTVTLGMPRIFDGPSPPTDNDRCQRVATSHHPSGKFVLVRIT